jgi:hypothetical protein
MKINKPHYTKEREVLVSLSLHKTVRRDNMYRYLGKEILSLYFGLNVFQLFEARVPEFDVVNAAAPVYPGRDSV